LVGLHERFLGKNAYKKVQYIPFSLVIIVVAAILLLTHDYSIIIII